MKRYQYYFAISIGLLLLLTARGYAQPYEHYSSEISVNLENTAVSLPLSFPDASFRQRMETGVIQVLWDTGEESKIGGTDFTAEVTFQLMAYRAGNPVEEIFSADPYKLVLNQDQPRGLITFNLLDYWTEFDGNGELSFDEVRITPKAISANVPNEIKQALQLRIRYAADIGIDVQKLDPIASAQFEPISFNGRVATFTWKDGIPFNNYQIQLLRLYNHREATATEPEEITTNIDWSQAATLEVVPERNGSGVKTVSISVAEGTGFYVFRIRPFSSYYSGSIADYRNWGAWSTHPVVGEHLIERNSIVLPYFYYVDQDEDHNWIYSRTFTENGRTKETVTYANSLQQQRQSQTYLSSKDTTVITQSILDYSGRPALTTIPMPVAGQISQYKEQFVRTKDEELYRAKHFDADEKITAPQTTDEAGSLSYYNSERAAIPKAEGYPYTRTTYYNDGTDRVKEQSGVGRTHMIGEQSKGQGRTTRYFYSTATESELIALFGDEAPSSESVTKKITVDPNNVASITYTSKGGKVIATSLAFYEEENSNLVPLDETSELRQEVSDRITTNVKTENGFVSSKRITLLQATNLNVNYSIRCEQLAQLCNDVTIDCQYHLQVLLHQLDNLGNHLDTEVISNSELGGVACEEGEDGESYKTVSVTSRELPPGAYIIEKRLVPGDPSIEVEENQETRSKQVSLLTNIITSWLSKVERPEDLTAFSASLERLANAVNNQTLASFKNEPNKEKFEVILPSDFEEVYFAEVGNGVLASSQYSMSLEATEAVINTPCCKNLTVSTQWIPRLACPKEKEPHLVDINNNGKLDFIDPFSDEDPEYLPDFEGFMHAYLAECLESGSITLSDIYREYMDGWKKGQFNLMVYHMLTDTYQVGNKSQGGGTSHAYECSALVDCWTGILAQMKEEACGGYDYGLDGNQQSVSSAYDSEYADDSEGGKPEHDQNHDEHFDENFKGGGIGKRLLKWIAKRKISKRMRDQQGGSGVEGSIDPVIGTFHAVETFLNCTGYQFAKIISPLDAAPLDDDAISETSSFGSYTELNDTPPIPTKLKRISKNTYFSSNDYRKSDNPWDYYYVPLSDWDPKKEVAPGSVGQSVGESRFPHIKNPIYAFKYFEYENDGKYQNLETVNCYTDPNDCYQLDADGFIVFEDGKPVKVPCCGAGDNCYIDESYPDGKGGVTSKEVAEFCGIGTIRCPYTHESWSAGQRYAFYGMIKGYEEINEIEEDYQYNCQSYQATTKWYENQNSDNGYLGWIDEGEYATLTDEQGDFRQLFLNKDGKTYEEFPWVVYEMEKLNLDCQSGCDSRKSEIKRVIYRVLRDKCYTVGTCTTKDTPEIVLEEEIDAMVAAIVEQCKNQCNVSTFSCDEVGCRDADASYYQPGPSRFDSNIQYGMGGYPESLECAEGETPMYDDDLNYQELRFDSFTFQSYVFPQRQNLSWYEYTKIKQAAEWDIEIDLPSHCRDANGGLITDKDWNCCQPNGTEPARGDTFVPRKEYEVDEMVPVDLNQPKVGTPATSPAKGIKVKVNQP